MQVSKATKFNRHMMGGMAVFAILLLAMVFGMLYYSFQNHEDKRVIKNMYNIRFASETPDSFAVSVNDSLIFNGVPSDTLFLDADGFPSQNMISVSDLKSGKTVNQNLPVEPTSVIINTEGQLSITTMRILAPVN